ncbi:RHS repeat-associated core domain-containing protein [Streptomyces sp. NPDC020883]|uniref:RHS repeat-associated core domain-containing protein n=1 Tax=Streptomyces sp. NPDC020883 TaxID=3365099 RepID=UPI00379E3B47
MSNPIVKALEHAAEKLGNTLGKDAGKAVEDLYHGTGQRMKKVAANHAENEAKQAEAFGKHLKDRGHPDTPASPRPGVKTGGSKSPGTHGETRDQLGKDHPNNSTRPKNSVCSNGTDPVDLASGKMYLPQTDVMLPGTLPLVFSRRVESGYRAGKWLGPSWSSTADQRLEIDDEGIIFVTEDGLLLCYPHPEDGGPVLPESGPRWPLRRDDAGDYSITDPATGRVSHFSPHHDELALIDEISDRNGQWISFDHDEDGTPTAIRHGAGYHLKLTVADGRITALHLAGAAPDGADQELIRYGYTDGNLTAVVNSSGLPLRFEYDGSGRVTSWTDTNGSRYEYQYDDQNRCIAEGGVEGHLSLRINYDQSDPATGLRMTTTTDSLGRTNRFLINDALQVVAEIDPLGGTVRTERDRYDRIVASTDQLGRTTRLTYDETGNVTSTQRPDGLASTAVYNELNLPVEITGPDGAAWRQEYDERGNRTSATDPSGATTRYSYDSHGHLASVTDALGHTRHIECNRAGLPLTTTDPLGAVTRYERDPFGRITSITDPLGQTTRLTWTVEGKLRSRIAPDGAVESWTYDGEGNCTTHTDASGGTTTYEYTHFDLLSAQTGADGARYEFTHDTGLRLTQVTSPQGMTWDYEYDSAGHLVSETDFDNRTLRYTHDPAGQLTARINALGQTITYTHDVLGRVVEKNADGRATTYEHDAAGNLRQATGPDARSTYQRDPMGRVTAETVNGRTVTYTYDALGRRTGRTTPSGATSAWTHDAAGRRKTLTASGHTLHFEHDVAGRETTRRLGETLTLAHTWDPVGRLMGQVLVGAGTHTVQRRSYSYRADGNLIGIDDHLNGPRTFELDPAGRVTAVHAQGWTETYAYDQAGNQTEAQWPSGHPSSEACGTRTYSGTRIDSAGHVRYEYDAQGRITLRQKSRLSRRPDTWRYTWDAEDRLVAVTTPDGQSWRYLYDPFGRRMAKQRLADDESVVEQVDFTWDGTTLAEQTTSSGTASPITLTWDHNGLRPIVQTERKALAGVPQQEIDQRFFAIITDLVGTPTELVDESGTVAWRTRATLWGTTTWARNSTAYTPLRFPGQYFDPESGLHYNLHRYYDPETARYTTPDPLGLDPAPNPSTYVHNPHAWTDPLGLSPYPDDPIKLYRAPHKGNRAREENGLDPALHPDTEHGEGTAYLGESEKVAQKYAQQGTHEDGYHEFVMKPGFREAFPESVSPPYRRTHDNKPDEWQWLIPREEIPKFNSYIQEVNWINYYQGHTWRD